MLTRIRIQLYISMRIRIQGDKPMRIRTRTLVRLLIHKKLNFYKKNKLKVGKRSKTVLYLRRVKSLLENQEIKFRYLLSGQDSQINANPCRSGSTALK
jgi:hypothetical protein